MLDVSEWGRLLMYSTQRGGVHALDHRAGRDAWVLPARARQVGMTCCMTAAAYLSENLQDISAGRLSGALVSLRKRLIPATVCIQTAPGSTLSLT